MLNRNLLFFLIIFVPYLSFSMPRHARISEMIHLGKINPIEMNSILQDDVERGLNQPTGVISKTNRSGSWKALAILVHFNDHSSSVNASFFDNLIFGTSTGTVNHYYQTVSYGNLDIVTLDLPSSTGWFTAPQNYSYYVNNNYGLGYYPQNAQKLAEDVINLADNAVDYSKYDNDGDGYADALFIIHSGTGAEYSGSNQDIWSHKWWTHSVLNLDGVNLWEYTMEPEFWDTPGDMTLGVFCHELGHMLFDLPDLYDTDDDSEGLGNWSLMAGGSWNGPNSLGGSPAFPDAYSHIRMGYVSPAIIESNMTNVSIPAKESSATVYKLWKYAQSGAQYFLVENRQQTSYDSYLPGNGLLIFHVETATGNQNNQWYPGHTSYGHYLVALEQADGDYDLEQNLNRGDSGDPYAGSANNRTFDENSDPDSKDYNGNKTYV